MDNLANLTTNISSLGLPGGPGFSALPDMFPRSSDPATQQAQQELLNLTNLYKTQLCKHWEQTGGHCPKGNSCHFAHGMPELR